MTMPKSVHLPMFSNLPPDGDMVSHKHKFQVSKSTRVCQGNKSRKSLGIPQSSTSTVISDAKSAFRTYASPEIVHPQDMKTEDSFLSLKHKSCHHDRQMSLNFQQDLSSLFNSEEHDDKENIHSVYNGSHCIHRLQNGPNITPRINSYSRKGSHAIAESKYLTDSTNYIGGDIKLVRDYVDISDTASVSWAGNCGADKISDTPCRNYFEFPIKPKAMVPPPKCPRNRLDRRCKRTPISVQLYVAVRSDAHYSSLAIESLG